MDISHLQLIFNVIAITGITSLAWCCYILKRENQALLAAKLTSSPERRSADSTPDQGAAIRKEPNSPPVPETDIRQFVTQRAQGWTAPSPSQWKAC
jgi:hypothetical protein